MESMKFIQELNNIISINLNFKSFYELYNYIYIYYKLQFLGVK